MWTIIGACLFGVNCTMSPGDVYPQHRVCEKARIEYQAARPGNVYECVPAHQPADVRSKALHDLWERNGGIRD